MISARRCAVAVLLVLGCAQKPASNGIVRSPVDLFGKDSVYRQPGTVNLHCPDLLIAKNIAEAGNGIASFIASAALQFDPKSCYAVRQDVFQYPGNLETFLAKYPYSRLGFKEDAIQQCLANNAGYQKLDHNLRDAVNRAVIADTYYYFNAFRAASLSAIEGIAAIDVLLGEPVLQSGGLIDPYIVESDRWVGDLQRNCVQNPRAFQNLITYSKQILKNDLLLFWRELHPQYWKDTVVLDGVPKALAPPAGSNRLYFNRMRQTMLASAPWLKAELVDPLRKALFIGVGALATPDAAADLINRRIENLTNRGLLKGKLVAQFAANRTTLYNKLGDYQHASNCLAIAGNGGCDTLVQKTINDIGFDPRQLENSRETTREYAEALKGKDRTMAFFSAGILSRVNQGFGAVSALHSASCRKDLRGSNLIMRDAAAEAAILAAIQWLPGGSSRLLGVAQKLARAEQGAEGWAVYKMALELTTVGASTMLGLGQAMTQVFSECNKAQRGEMANLQLPIPFENSICYDGRNIPNTSIPNNRAQLLPQAINDYRACVLNAVAQGAVLGIVSTKALQQSFLFPQSPKLGAADERGAVASAGDDASGGSDTFDSESYGLTPGGSDDSTDATANSDTATGDTTNDSPSSDVASAYLPAEDPSDEIVVDPDDLANIGGQLYEECSDDTYDDSTLACIDSTYVASPSLIGLSELDAADGVASADMESVAYEPADDAPAVASDAPPDDSEVGSTIGACNPDGTCDDPTLSCVGGTCVDPSQA